MGAEKITEECLRLPLGLEALEKAREKVLLLSRNLDLTEDIAKSTTYDDAQH
jgi:hypothetical protein